MRIFVISAYALFSNGLRDLLTQEPSLEIIGEAETLVEAFRHIEILHPDVIILDCTDSLDGSGLAEIALLKAKPGIRVVSLSLKDNSIFIYQSTQKFIQSVSDLLSGLEEALCLEPVQDFQFKQGPVS